MPHNRPVEFHEEQQFRQPWLWVLLLAMTAGVSALFLYGLYTQLVLGQPWGDRPMSDTGLVISAVLTIGISGGISVLFLQLKLITTVDADGVQVRFFPLTRKHIAFRNIVSSKARTYRPIREYGGWGIRFSRKGRAYNVSGDRGVQLELRDGMPLLIGSQKAEQLADAINRHI